MAISPWNQRLVDQVRYRSDGTIYSDNGDIDKDLNKTLNLNCTAAKLPMNRKAALNSFQAEIKKAYSGRTLTQKDWEMLLKRQAETNANGELKPFVGIIEKYIEKKLHRR